MDMKTSLIARYSACILSVGLLLLPSLSSAENRTALVIGNANYQVLPSLRNPVRDARDITAKLRGLGFKVIEKLDVSNQEQMEEAMDAFGQLLSQRGGVGLFYYSGHGVQAYDRQVNMQQNYLIPVQADIKKQTKIKHRALSVGVVLDELRAAGNEMNIIILDACRNNPFDRSRGVFSPSRGLARMSARSGSLIAYSTAPDRAAEDGEGLNGTYTKHLLRYMDAPGLSLEQMFKRVRVAVEDETNGQQSPREVSSLRGDFYFSGKSFPAPIPEPVREPVRRSFEPEMVRIPGGRFRMGDIQGVGFSNEQPVHSVTITGFAMSKYEVTFAEYDAFVVATGRDKPNDYGGGRGQRPIDVSWEDATAYAEWLSQQTGKGYRLPSESEWEYAARAGSESQYSWGNEVGVNRANCDGCGSQWDNQKAAPVGSFNANGFGLHDMHGNEWEWVQDCWNDSYGNSPSNNRANLSGDCTRRVLRGGSWDSPPWLARSASRDEDTATFGVYIGGGFRLAQD